MCRWMCRWMVFRCAGPCHFKIKCMQAMFGDSYVHQSENLQQLRGYVNRFGPGMVIYWFGFVATLNDDPDVLLVDAIPDSIHFTELFFIS